MKFSGLSFAMAIASLSLAACGGGGKATAVSPPPSSTANEWTWVNGANVVSQLGTYGTQGTPAPTNVPGARFMTATWTDASGNFWLFAGNGGAGAFNDVWKYSEGAWTWVSGSNAPNELGIYGTPGVSAPGNVPGARSAPVIWTDASGNFWFFGGCGYDAVGAYGYLSDLWSYTASSGSPQKLNDLWKYSGGAWTWMSGSSTSDEPGTYGTEGISASGNTPGARAYAVNWTDAAGNLWLFGGAGLDSASEFGTLNDLWSYSVSAGEWTWMGGSNMVNQTGTYGTQGTAASSNIPGSRGGAVGAVDAAGNFWLFGGLGYDSVRTYSQLNDLWKYSAGQWRWMSGSNLAGQQGIYGTQGTAAPGEAPGARYFAGGWIDAAGNFWLFGGQGYDSPGTYGYLNDLWEYQP